MKDAALYYEIQIPSPQPWVLGWALCSWKVWLAWHLFYWLGRKKSSCIWALSLKSTAGDRKAALASGEENVTALLCKAQFISGHRWGTWINHKLNWALIYIKNVLETNLEQCWQSSLLFSATPAVPQDVGKAWNILQQYNRSWRGKQRCPLQQKW